MSHTKILLIVDDWEALERYEEMLQSHFTVSGVPFADEGIKAAQQESPQRIMLDLVFEDMDAFEATNRLRENSSTSGIPIVIIVNEGEPAVAIPGVFPSVAGDQCVHRPFDKASLVKALS